MAGRPLDRHDARLTFASSSSVPAFSAVERSRPSGYTARFVATARQQRRIHGELVETERGD